MSIQRHLSLANVHDFKHQWALNIDAARIAWGKLTQYELLSSEGHRQRLADLIQERYATTRDEADRQVRCFFERQAGSGSVHTAVPEDTHSIVIRDLPSATGKNNNAYLDSLDAAVAGIEKPVHNVAVGDTIAGNERWSYRPTRDAAEALRLMDKYIDKIVKVKDGWAAVGPSGRACVGPSLPIAVCIAIIEAR